MDRDQLAVPPAPVLRVTPDMIVAHEWYEINYWRYPLWKCRRCKMQTKILDLADVRPCLPTKRGLCRVCHDPARTKTSLYCRWHVSEARQARRKLRPLTDAQILKMRADNIPLRVIAEQLRISYSSARSLVERLEYDAYWGNLLRLERVLGPCACGDRGIYILGRRYRGDGPVKCKGCYVVRRESSVLGEQG
jgi:hypothetical protein